MKAYIWREEVYPVYGIWEDVDGESEIEISEELYERYLKVGEEYEQVQEELVKLYAIQ